MLRGEGQAERAPSEGGEGACVAQHAAAGAQSARRDEGGGVAQGERGCQAGCATAVDGYDAAGARGAGGVGASHEQQARGGNVRERVRHLGGQHGAGHVYRGDGGVGICPDEGGSAVAREAQCAVGGALGGDVGEERREVCAAVARSVIGGGGDETESECAAPPAAVREQYQQQRVPLMRDGDSAVRDGEWFVGPAGAESGHAGSIIGAAHCEIAPRRVAQTETARRVVLARPVHVGGGKDYGRVGKSAAAGTGVAEKSGGVGKRSGSKGLAPALSHDSHVSARGDISSARGGGFGALCGDAGYCGGGTGARRGAHCAQEQGYQYSGGGPHHCLQN